LENPNWNLAAYSGSELRRGSLLTDDLRHEATKRAKEQLELENLRHRVGQALPKTPALDAAEEALDAGALPGVSSAPQSTLSRRAKAKAKTKAGAGGGGQ
jgi:hypothetical protein